MDPTTPVSTEITWCKNGVAINLEDIADVGRLQPPQRYLVWEKVEKICANFAATRIASEKFEKICKENRRKIKNEKFFETFRLIYGENSKHQDAPEQQECYIMEDSDESQATTTSKHHHEDNAIREGLSKLSPPQLLLVAYYAEMYDFRLLVKKKQFDIFVRLCQDVKVAVEVKGTKKVLGLGQTEHLIIHIIEHDLDRAEKFPQFKKQWEQYNASRLGQSRSCYQTRLDSVSDAAAPPSKRAQLTGDGDDSRASHTTSYPRQFGVPSWPAPSHQTDGITGGYQVTARVTSPQPFELATQHVTYAIRNDEDYMASYSGTSASSSPSEQNWLPTSPNWLSQHSEVLQIENHVTPQEVISQHEHAFNVPYDPAFLPPFEVPHPGFSTSQPADMTDLKIPVKAQRDILKISACIEARKPMWKLSELEYLGHAYGEEDSEGAIIRWKYYRQVIVQKSILLNALQKICTSASCILSVHSNISIVELVFEVNNTTYTSRMQISSEVALEIKTDWERILFANYFDVSAGMP